MAIDQVKEIAEYISLDKPATALKWAEDIFDSLETLSEFPESGRIVNEIKRKEIREIVYGNFRIIYKIKNETILILLVKRHRQKLKSKEILP